MRVWSTAAQKGGVGKSTLAVSLAAYAEQCGEMTLILDLDPQGSMGMWSQRRMTRSPMVVESLPDNLDKIIEESKTFGVSLVILDTAPHSDKVALAAIKRSDLIICPSQPNMFDLTSLRDTVNILTHADAVSKAVGVLNFLPTDRSAKTAYAEAVGPMESFGLTVCPHAISFRRSFPNALALGKAVTETEPKGKAAEEIIAVWNWLNTISPIAVKPKRVSKKVTA
jgi:chromosome partitioning protein